MALVRSRLNPSLGGIHPLAGWQPSAHCMHIQNSASVHLQGVPWSILPLQGQCACWITSVSVCGICITAYAPRWRMSNGFGVSCCGVVNGMAPAHDESRWTSRDWRRSAVRLRAGACRGFFQSGTDIRTALAPSGRGDELAAMVCTRGLSTAGGTICSPLDRLPTAARGGWGVGARAGSRLTRPRAGSAR
jgi:hypothetical protein